MKKRYVPILFLVLALLIVLPMISAQTYSGFNRFTDNIKLFFSSGDNKVKLALEIREKELNLAMYNAQIGNDEEVVKNLESAITKLKIVQERVSPDTADEVKNNIDEVKRDIEENTDIDSDFFEKYLTEEEKTKLSADLSLKTFNYCEELAMQDYELMLKDEKCATYSWMEKKIEQRLNEEQEKSQNEIKNQIQICMNNPKKCNCNEISLFSEKKKCEEYKSLTIKCEFKNDGSACKEIDKIEDVKDSDRENYEKEILEKYVPGECLEAGIKDGEECKKLIITINKPESECMENEEYVGEEKCKEKLVNQGNVVKECVINGKLVDPEQCRNIVKEGNKPTGEEFELMSGECKERGIYDPVACNEIVNLPRPCKDSGYYTKRECEAFTLNNNLPQECVNAGALTPESCEKFKLPSDCQGAYSRVECDQIKIEQKFPDECKSAGELDPKKCAVIMIGEQSLIVTAGAEMEYLIRQGLTFEEIPDVCMNGKNFIRSMDCDAELAKLGITLPTPTDTGGIPKECMIDERTSVSPQECQNRIEKNIIIDTIPKECQDAEVTNPEECSSLMEEKRIEQGIGINMPEECMGISAEECKTIMEEKGIKVEKIEQVQKVEKVQKMCKEGEECEEEPVEYEEVTIPKECIKLGISDYETCKISMSKINEERIKQGDEIVVDEEGNVDYITNEEIGKLAEKAEKQSQDLKPDITNANEIKQEVTEIENAIDTIEASMTVDKAPKTKENEDVSPAPNIVNGGVDPGPEGIVGHNDIDSSDNSAPSNSIDNSDGSGSDSDSGEDSGITGEVIKTSNKESFLGKILKEIFGI